MKLALALVLMLSTTILQPALSAVPNTMSYQAVLRDASGQLVADGNYNITFAIYNVPSGGTALWTETQTLAVSKGLFNAVLGVNTPLNLPFDTTYYLGVKIGTGAELGRHRLTSSPYAIRAAYADTGAPDGDWTIVGNNMYSGVSGNVGVGTTSPSAKLDIDGGDLRLRNNRLHFNYDVSTPASGPALKWTDGGTTNTLGFYVNGGVNYQGDAGNPDFRIRTPTTNGALGTEVVRLGGGSINANSWFNAGNLGIGTTTPNARLHVLGGQWDLGHTEGDVKIGDSNYRLKLGISTGGAGAGTGRLYSCGTSDGNSELILGANATDVVSIRPTGMLVMTGSLTAPVLHLTGGADLAEPFEISAAPGGEGTVPQPGMVVSIDRERTGSLVVSNCAYDPTVAGIVSGAGGIHPGMVMGQSGTTADGDTHVALSGRVYCWADASFGSIEPGSLLTTSTTPGYAMRASDPSRATGAILGKAMSSLKTGKGLVLVLVSLQ